MKADATRMPLARLAAVASVLASGPVLTAEWSVLPGAQLYTQLQGNPRLNAEESETATAMGTSVALELARRTEALELTLTPRASFHRYQQDTDLDRNDLQVEAALRRKGEHSSWVARARGTRDSTLTSELGSTGLTQLNRRHEKLDVSVEPTWQLSERTTAGSSLAWQADRYAEPAHSELRDYRYGTLSSFVSHLLSDRTNLSLNASVGSLRSDASEERSKNASLRLQAHHTLSPYWSMSIGAGPSWVRADQTSEGIVYDAQITRRFERASVSLSASRSQSPSGRGLLTELDEARLAFSTQLTERVLASLQAGLIRRRDAVETLGLRVEDVRYGRIDGSLSWRMSPRWQVTMSAGRSGQKAETLRQDGTAHGYDARVSLNWRGAAHVR